VRPPHLHLRHNNPTLPRVSRFWVCSRVPTLLLPLENNLWAFSLTILLSGLNRLVRLLSFGRKLRYNQTPARAPSHTTYLNSCSPSASHLAPFGFTFGLSRHRIGIQSASWRIFLDQTLPKSNACLTPATSSSKQSSPGSINFSEQFGP